jgi:hypothetical protein
MALDDLFQVLAELFIERDRRAMRFREGNALRKHPARPPWGLSDVRRSDDGHRPVVLFDHNLGAGAHPFQHAVNIARELGLGDVQRRHIFDDTLFFGLGFSSASLEMKQRKGY